MNRYFKNQLPIAFTLRFIVSISQSFATADYIVSKYLIFFKISDLKKFKTSINIQLPGWTVFNQILPNMFSKHIFNKSILNYFVFNFLII